MLERWPCWDELDAKQMKRGHVNRNSISMSRRQSEECRILSADGAKRTWGDAMTSDSDLGRRVVLHPDKPGRLFWTLFGGVLIGYDVVMIPMIAFTLPIEHFATVMAITTSVFWTCDIPLTFLTGYHVHGVLEMRPSQIARNYAKNWLVLDTVVTTADWVVLILDAAQNSKGTGFFRVSKFLRASRILRLARMMRLFKLSELFNYLIDRLPSEHFVALARMCRLVLVIVLISHYVACIWYGIATELEGQMPTWTTVLAADQEMHADALEGSTHGLLYLYASALHWALTQFTPAPMEIAPTNVWERLFAIGVVLSALVVFSSFIGSISAKITEIRQLQAERHLEEARIRDYLGSKHISLEVGSAIWCFLRADYKVRKRQLHEEDIRFFEHIPQSLRIKLRIEVYSPILVSHPFLSQFVPMGFQQMSDLCNTAMAERSYRPSQDVFVENQLATEMYFVITGELEYRSDLLCFPIVVRPGSHRRWISEGALWAKWFHLGQLMAQCSCELATLDAKRFRDLVSTSLGCLAFSVAVRRHAAAYCEMVQTSLVTDCSVTDITELPETLKDMVKETWNVCRAYQPRGKSPAASRSGSISGRV